MALLLTFFLYSLGRAGWSGWLVKRCHGQWSSQGPLLLIQNPSFVSQCWWIYFCHRRYVFLQQCKNCTIKKISNCGEVWRRYWPLHLQAPLLPWKYWNIFLLFSVQQREAAGLKLLFLHENLSNSLFDIHYFFYDLLLILFIFNCFRVAFKVLY